MTSEEKIKGGLAARMREWMSAVNMTFDFGLMCRCLEIPQGAVRFYVLRILRKFVERGEVQVVNSRIYWTEEHRRKVIAGQVPGTGYRYNHSWRRPSNAPLKQRILKSMRLISFGDPFSVADVQSLANAPERSSVDKIVKRLVEEKYICRIGDRVSHKGHGRESLYRVTDPTKFRIDLL